MEPPAIITLKAGLGVAMVGRSMDGSMDGWGEFGEVGEWHAKSVKFVAATRVVL